MSVVHEKYTEARINLLYQMLANQAAAGKPREYDIKVDELKVIPRTSDPEEFHNYEDFVLIDTSSVTISLYEGTSRRCTHFVLLLKEAVIAPQNTLAGVEQAIEEKLTQERMRWDHEQALKEKLEAKQALAEAEEFIEKLEQEITALREEKQSSKGKMSEAILGLAGMYLSKNPSALAGIPLLGNLLGGSAAIEPVNPPTEMEEVTFTKGYSTAPVEPKPADSIIEPAPPEPLTPKQIETRLIESLAFFFGETDTPTVMRLLNKFLNKRELLPAATDFITRQEGKPRSEDRTGLNAAA